MQIKLTEADLAEMVKCVVVEVYDGLSGGAYNGSRYLAESINSKNRQPIYSSINEGVEFEPSPNEKGGIITFSTAVNAEKQSENKVVNFIKQRMMSLSNRINATKKVDKIASEHNLVGWTIGHYLSGRYTNPDTGEQYGENSLSLEIIGVPFSVLESVSRELCIAFNQKSVLLKDYSSGRVVFLDRR